MSCCLIVQDKNNLFIGADSAITVFDNNKFKRVGDSAEKVFYTNGHAFFCSGNLVYSELVKSYILKNKCMDEFRISNFIRSLNIQKIEGINSIEVVMCCKGKMVQISEYNDFNPVHLNVTDNGVQIYSTGFKTKECLGHANSLIESGCGVYKVFENTFKHISCEEVGGNLKVIDVINGSEKIFVIDSMGNSNIAANSLHYINTEVLMGRLVATSQLIIENEGGTFLVDSEGVTLVNAKLIIRNEDGDSTIEDELNKKAQTYHSNKAPSPPEHRPKAGDIWFDTSKDNKRHRYDGIQWISVEYTGINSEVSKQIKDALDKITDVEAKADGKVEIFYSQTDPTTNSANDVKHGDIWVDISLNQNNKPKNKMHRRVNNKWESIEDSSINDIFGQLGGLESAIDGKVTTYYCTKEKLPPSNQLHEGDLWVDTSNNNKLMIRHGVYWVDVSIMGEDVVKDWAEAIKKSTEALEKADQALALEDKMVHTYYQESTPGNPGVGDLWVNTKTGRVNIYTSLGWKESKDQSVNEAITKAQQAMDKADTKATTYYQDTMPTTGEKGDLWVHTGRDNEVFVHNGSTFVKTMGDLQGNVGDLVAQLHDGYFDHGQKYWSKQYNGQNVESTTIGEITNDGISGSKAWKIQGQHSIYSKNAIPVDTDRVYKFMFKIKQVTHAKTEYPLSQWFERSLSSLYDSKLWDLTWFLSQEMKIRVGVVCLDRNFNTLGAAKYFVINERLLSLNEGWVSLEATISGVGSEVNKFTTNTSYMRPTFTVNYPNGDGEVLIDSFVIKDITEAKAAQDTADDAKDKIDNVITIEGNLNTKKLEGSLNAHANNILAGANMQLQIDKDGIWAMNNGNKDTATKIVAMNENGIVMAKERVGGKPNWRTAISADGINADEINTGKLRALDILGCKLEVSNERNKILVNPTDGIKIQKKSGTLWKDTMYIDSNGDATFTGKLVGNEININDNFKVDTSGNVIANSIRITRGVINDSDLVGGSLNIGSGNFVVDKSGNLTTRGSVTLGGSISWGASNSPVKVQYSTSGSSGWHDTFQSGDKFSRYSYDGGKTWTGAMKVVGDDGSNGQNGLNGRDAQLPEFITQTYIDATRVESPIFKGGLIEGCTLRSRGTSKSAIEIWSEWERAGYIRYDSAGNGSTEGTNRMYIATEGNYNMKLQSAQNMSLKGNKIYFEGDCVFNGTMTDSNGNPIGGGKAVFA